MFSKLKKPPLSLNSVSNAIKNKDTLLPPINSKELGVELINQYGLQRNSIITMAFDPVQSLLAISTNHNEIRVIGQSTVEVVFEFNSPTPIVHLRFVKGIYLVAILSNSNITILSLHTKQILKGLLAPGSVSCVASDPSLDWLILGLNNGSLIFLDVDRLNIAPLRIDNLQKRILHKEKLSPVLNIEWHPRDIGTILVTYSHSSIVYSLSMGEIKSEFIFKISKGCKIFDWSIKTNEGKRKMFGSPKEIISELIGSHFHPNGLHVVTIHKDNSLVFWDVNTSTLLESRNLFDINLHKTGPSLQYNLETNLPIETVQWICGQDPELTKLIVVGGTDTANQITIIDFGLTLKYSLTSYEKQSEFYSYPLNGIKNLNIPFYESNEFEKFVNVLSISGDNLPYFNGGHNPNYLILKSNLNNIYLMPLNDVTNDLGKVLLPPSIAFIHPPVTFSNIENVKRIDWYSVQSSRISSGIQAKTELLLKGGAATNETYLKPIGFNDAYRKILITGHERGIVRLLDITKSEVDEQEGLIQLSLKETLVSTNPLDLKIVSVSGGFESKDLVIGLGNGDIVICKFGKINQNKTPNPNNYNDCPIQHRNEDGKIINLKQRIRGSFASSSTFLPMYLMRLDTINEISCLKACNIGFVAIAYKTGKLVVCDIGRGPAIIFNLDKISSVVPTASTTCFATSMEFTIMEYGQEGYSSIILIVGTNDGGNLLYFKILPQPNGGFEVKFIDKTIKLNYKSLEDSCIKQIIPIDSKYGQLAIPTLDTFHKLSSGILIPGYIIVNSNKDIRILKPPKQKLSHKVVDDFISDIGITNIGVKDGIILTSILQNGFIKFSTIPQLSDVVDFKLSKNLIKNYDFNQITECKILTTGEVYLKFQNSEFINLSIFSKDKLKKNKGMPVDLLFNVNSIIPPRPTVSALQWAKGNQVILVNDLNSLIGGPNRKPAKHIESQIAFNISPESNPTAGYGTTYTNNAIYNQSTNFNNSNSSLTNFDDKNYTPPVRKNNQTKSNLGTTGFMRSLKDGIDSVEESFNGYANTMSEAMTDTVESSKREMYSSAFKSKFGF